MKIKKSQLQKIIQEEATRSLKEWDQAAFDREQQQNMLKGSPSKFAFIQKYVKPVEGEAPNHLRRRRRLFWEEYENLFLNKPEGVAEELLSQVEANVANGGYPLEGQSLPSPFSNPARSSRRDRQARQAQVDMARARRDSARAADDQRQAGLDAQDAENERIRAANVGREPTVPDTLSLSDLGTGPWQPRPEDSPEEKERLAKYWADQREKDKQARADREARSAATDPSGLSDKGRAQRDACTARGLRPGSRDCKNYLAGLRSVGRTPGQYVSEDIDLYGIIEEELQVVLKERNKQ
tara:strand:+ start:232 stop:1119 length:888 start_codon:yes stop_codon:yes gene_type:complete